MSEKSQKEMSLADGLQEVAGGWIKTGTKS